MKNKLGIYIHVPFCAAKCSYCDFYSLSGKLEQRDAYVERLLTELVQQSSACQDYTVDTVYFGGGTPSLLGGARIARIVDTIRAHYALEPDAELTAEANPDSMTDDFLTISRAAGINRLSMGIQSANDRELHAIGRIHTFAQAQDAFFRARRAGFANLSVDLMYALPGQSMEQLCASLDSLLDLQPEHLSCYGLTLEAHTPLDFCVESGAAHISAYMLKLEEGTPYFRKKESLNLPDEDTVADMYLAMSERLSTNGFEHYEISNFAKPGFASRHNSRYWKQSPYLGFGPGAHGDFAGQRYEIPRDLSAWLRGEAQPEREDEHEIDRAAEYIMLSLRTSAGFDAEFYTKQFSADPAPVERALSRLPKQYVHHTGSRWSLTEDGFLISNAVIVSVLEEI